MKKLQATFGKMSIGERLRWLMEARGYKQVEIAQKVGVTQAAISNLVTDTSRKPSASTLLRLAAALDANPEWILTGEGDPYMVAPPSKEVEQEILSAFRALSREAQSALLVAAKAMRRE